ncbi:Eco29kI family restriction endonuclease [Micromonospora aurantiaca]|uniref:Eco29kI family restriction endonuclease n=1 Tax=Micromonospora aurantiaca (nom. illeg.) TaxID=47850 RepID=UPI0033D5631A
MDKKFIPLSHLDADPFWGNGVYAIYYSGPHPIYQAVRTGMREHPVYVGLSTSDRRKSKMTYGRPIEDYLDELATDEKPKPTLTLFDRLRDHQFSISQVAERDERMGMQFFGIKYLVTESIFSFRAESILKDHYRPVWNDCVDGFGNKDPGGTRRGDESGPIRGTKPVWDTLHPGRFWADYMHDGPLSRPQLEEKVIAYLATLAEEGQK